jgi:hypothetical protein
LDDLEEVEGTQVLDELESLKSTIYTVNRNFEELNEIDQWFADQGFEIQMMKHRGELDEFYREYQRRLHNYVVSVYSLIEQSKRANGKAGIEGFDDVYSEGLERFDIVERWKFLEQFRHHIQKSEFPSLDLRIVEEEEGIRYGILISRDEMLEQGTFKSWGREYLESKESKIDIQKEVRRYHENVNDFYSWYYDALQENRAEALQEREEIIDDMEEKRSELFDGLRD